MAQYNEKIGERTPDNLIVNFDVNPIVNTGTVASGEGVLARGTVLTRGEDGKLSVLGKTEGAVACGVLAESVDAASADAVAEFYVAGCLNKRALIVAEGYTITDADLTALRNGGIYVENTVQ